MKLLKKMYIQVLIGLFLGVLIGCVAPHVAIHFKILSDLFIKIIKMLIGPIVFLTLVSGIAAMNDLRQVSKMAGSALIFFMILTTFALTIGIVATDYFKPGVGLNIDPSSLDIEAASAYIGKSYAAANASDLFLHFIPDTFLSAFVDGDMIQVIFISLLFAIGLILLGPASQPIVEGMHTLAKVFFKIIHVVMHLAPIATCSAMAFSVGKFGLAPLLGLAGLVFCYYITCIFFIVLVLGSILYLYCGVNIFRLIGYLKDELVIVWGTGSSETVLPVLMEKLEQLGCDEGVVGLVLPLGYSFNLAGTAIYLTMAALFIAQATNTPLTLSQELCILAVMIISSKGAAGVTGSGFIVLASSLATIGYIPVAGVILILGIDKFLNEGRAIINMIGNAMTTILISAWQKSLNHEQLHRVLKKK